jgi:HD-GYP domain-containing protein (c-di-GMP phosphodiesterase class II)
LLNNSIADIQKKQEAREAFLEENGRRLIPVLYATFKVAVMYEANNNRYIEQASKLREIMNSIFTQEDDFSITIKGGYIFLSEARLRADHDINIAMNYFQERWQGLGVSGFSFNINLDPRELDKFIFLVSGFEIGEDKMETFQAFKDRLDQLRIEKITPAKISVEEPEKDLLDDKKDSTRVSAKKTFFNAIAVVQDTLTQARNNNNINIGKTKRAVQELINRIIDDEAAMMELTSIRSFDDYTYVHSVNVCVLSLVLGFHLGLERKALSNLGVGALLHDIGKTKLPLELVNKPSSFDEYDWQMMRKHPIFGVKALLKTRMADETTSRASSAIFEHHLALDGSGYPELPNKRKPSLYARIVSIADTYNAMTSGRVYHKQRHLPDEAITSMVNKVDKAFDPILLKVFINTMGIYPVGTVVALSSREVGIIARNNPDHLERPQVKIIANEEGLFQLNEVKVIDLSKDSEIKVTRIIDDDKYNIDVANYIDIG